MAKSKDEKVKYWIELSEYDLDTALAMLTTKRYLYVGFMCHQSIEKIFKAYYLFNKSEAPPYSHALSFIAKKGDFYNYFSKDQKEFIDQIEPLNIEGRYPAQKDRLLKSLTHEKCQKMIEETSSLLQWIKEKL